MLVSVKAAPPAASAPIAATARMIFFVLLFMGFPTLSFR
jgi:hypothetical protein